MIDESLLFWVQVTVTFPSGGYESDDVTWCQIDIYLICLHISAFLTVFYPDEYVSYDIHDIYMSVWQEYDACQLNSYDT